MKVFLDTNVLIYLNYPDDRKAAIAVALLEAGGASSVQVLNEYCSVCRKKGKQGWEEISQSCADFQEILEVHDLTLEGHTMARQYSARFGYSIYDANIIASAKLAGCDRLLSEDMQHGQVIDGVTITNPFL